MIFWAFLVNIFKNKKLIKKSEKTFPRYLDGLGKFMVIFVQKYFFTLVQKNGGGEPFFLQFLKNF